MIGLDFRFLPQRVVGTKWSDKKMLTRWECEITEDIELEEKEAIPFLYFAPTTYAELLYGCPWPTNEITIVEQEESTKRMSKYTVKDPILYNCIEDAMTSAMVFRKELSVFIDLWRDSYADVKYKVIGE